MRADASVLVAERLEVLNRPGGPIGACVPRVLPTQVRLRHGRHWYRDAQPTYDQVVALAGAAPARVDEARGPDGERALCLGAPEGGLPEGRHTFTLSYVTDDRLVVRRDREVLVFDVTGRVGQIPVRRASATVHLPPGADLVSAERAGLAGRQDFTVRVGRQEGADRVDYAVWRPLGRDMGFDVAVTFTRGFATPGLWRRARQLDRETGRLLTSLLVLVVGLGATLATYTVAWRRVGRDPRPGLVVPGLEVPEESPALVRHVTRRRRVDDVSLAATLVRLAQEGAVAIDEDRGVYRIRSPSPTAGGAPVGRPAPATVLDEVTPFDLGTSGGRAAVRRLRAGVRSWLAAESRAYLRTNARRLWPGLLLSAATVAGSHLVLDWTRVGDVRTLLGTYTPFQVSVLGGLALLFHHLLRAPTAEGRRLLDRVAGYRQALAAVFPSGEGGRASPGVPPELVRHLPFAMALGLDCDGLVLRPGATGWFRGRSGGFSVGDFVAAFRRHVPAPALRSRVGRERGPGDPGESRAPESAAR